MKSISDFLGLGSSKATSERSSVIEEFVEAINLERGKKYGKIKAKVIAIKLSHLKLQELYWFLSVCKDYKNRNGSFSKCFWGSLKVNKDKDK